MNKKYRENLVLNIGSIYFKVQIFLLSFLLLFLVLTSPVNANFFINNIFIVFLILASCIIYFLFKNNLKKNNFFLIHISTLFSLFLLNFLLELKSMYFSPDNRVEQFEKKGVVWDKRKHNEVVDDLRKKTGKKNVYRVANPSGFIIGNIAEKINFNLNIVPLSNIEEKKKNRVALVRLLFLGKIDKRKGIFDVLESVKKNKELFENKIKIIVGGNGEVDMLKRIILEGHLSNIVEYVGWVTGEKKTRLFLESDIMLLPSYNEGLPISLLEALSYKMPLISTHVGGISEILEHKKNGFVVEAGNINQITESLRFYLENKSLIKLHGDNSYRIANRYFPEFVFNQLDKIYKDLLDEC